MPETARPSPTSTIATSQQYRERYAPTQPDMIAASFGSTALQVANSGDTNVSIQNGGAIVQGCRYDLTGGPLLLPVATNGGGSNRFDLVCLTYDASHDPMVYARIVQGTPGAGLPALTNNPTGVWDFPIAEYQKTPAGAITGLIDRRKFSNGLGGIVTNPVGGFPPAPYVGMTMEVHPDQMVYRYDGTNWNVASYGPEIIRRKTAHETVNNSTVLQDDDVLSISGLIANAVYQIDLFLIIASPSAAPDLKMGFSIPSGATFRWTPDGLDPTVTAQEGIIRRPMETTSTRTLATVGPAMETVATPAGRLVMGASSGALTLRWAQNLQTAENTQIQNGSTMRARRIG